MGSEDRIARMGANSEAIRNLWRPDAQKILDLAVQGNEMVVVEGLGGSGKSTNLTPNLVNAISGMGGQAIMFDCQRLASAQTEYVLGRFSDLVKPNTGNVFLIIDESGVIEDKDVPPLVRQLHENGVKCLIPFARGPDEEVMVELAKPWLDAERRLGKKATVYELKPKQLPTELAAEFLQLRGTETEITKFVVDNFPRYARILERMSGARTKAEVVDAWRVMCSRFKDGYGFTIEEAKEVDRRLGIETILDF